MTALILAAWLGLPTQGSFDPEPLLWMCLIQATAWALAVRLRWWSLAPVAVAGTLCTTLASHFGLWLPALGLTVYIGAVVFLQRVSRPG